MVIEEVLSADRVKHYSSEGKQIRQVGTGNVFESAIDVYPCPYEYEECDGQPEDESAPDELLSMLEDII